MRAMWFFVGVAWSAFAGLVAGLACTVTQDWRIWWAWYVLGLAVFLLIAVCLAYWYWWAVARWER